jgi:1-acyl-sn-glycerol-3-phosphate acyltransferase
VFYYFAYILVKTYARLLCGKNVIGRDHIPDKGPLLVVTNHLSSVDPPLVIDLIPIRLKLTGMAAMAHRNDPFIGWLLDKAGAIWVRRGQSDRGALNKALEILAAGRTLGVAPEGTRSRTGALIEGKTGVTFLAIKAGVPILPMVLIGTEKVFPNLRKLHRTTVGARIGPVFHLPERGDSGRREHLEYCTDLIMARLASMLPESYRGVYVGHPLIAYWEQLDASGTAHRPDQITL